MREIKFRAWDDERKRMILQTGTKWENGYYYPFGFSIGRLVSFNELIFLQYTGLKDRNSVEIYEGDIVETDNFAVKKGVVVWDKDAHQFSIKSKDNKYDFMYCCLDCAEKVIGNIYENPELLEDN
jgi:uncharacterized phage protein (TIGR01671 family)